jgi:hypothetical protein
MNGRGLSEIENGVFALASSIERGLRSVSEGLTELAGSMLAVAASLEHIALNISELGDE